MRKNIMNKIVCFFILSPIIMWAKPMESMDEYKIILIHGAGSHWGGLDCENGDYSDAFETIKNNNDRNKRIGGIDGKSSATGMIKELKPWIQDTLFGGDYDNLVYLQRPFTNLANSPSNNGKEIGMRAWIGGNMCSARHLIRIDCKNAKLIYVRKFL